MQNDGFVTNYQRVTGIVAALVTDDLLGMLRVDVNDFTFAFVTPLGADNDDICHIYLLNPELAGFYRCALYAGFFTVRSADQG